MRLISAVSGVQIPAPPLTFVLLGTIACRFGKLLLSFTSGKLLLPVFRQKMGNLSSSFCSLLANLCYPLLEPLTACSLVEEKCGVHPAIRNITYFFLCFQLVRS